GCEYAELSRRCRNSLTQPISIFFFQAEDGIRFKLVTGVQTCALPILLLAQEHPHRLREPPRRPGCLPRRREALRRRLRRLRGLRSEERRVGKECRYGWRSSP